LLDCCVMQYRRVEGKWDWHYWCHCPEFPRWDYVSRYTVKLEKGQVCTICVAMSFHGKK